MSFSQFCEGIDDGQKIVAKEAFVLSFTNTADEVFNIDPTIIYEFLTSLVNDHEVVFEKWSAVPTRKASLHIYEEKSYRVIYKHFTSDDLKVISSIGSSQTKALTQLIAKVISYLAGETYTDPSVNTFFETQSVSKALSKWGNLLSSDMQKSVSDDIASIRDKFRRWLLANGQSERSAYSHAQTSISSSDKRLKELEYQNKSLFLCTSKEVLEALEALKKDEDWSNLDKNGNMYSGGVKKLAVFLEEKDVQLRESEVKVYMFKPFVLLAGISGTGKTRFVREQVKASGDLVSNYQLTPVRPDWHEPGDLLGYHSRLSGKTEYVVTDILRFICSAWRAIADSEVVIEEVPIGGSGRVCGAVGEKDQLEGVMPFWLCLDEMNLAPVEQYFADYLSILETREWRWDGSSFSYICDPLLPSSIIGDLAVEEQEVFRASVGLADPAYDSLWNSFHEHGIGIPFNLIVAGTVNMDETTHGFSRKVLDRALTLDFDEFFPNDFNAFFQQQKKPVTFTYPILSAASLDKLPTIDDDGTKSIEFLKAINKILDDTPFKIAFRAVNELLLMVTTLGPGSELALKAVWDDFIMLKVLPRIEGDIDKLGKGQADNTLLTELNDILTGEFASFHDKQAGTEGARPDLFQVAYDDGEVTTACRSIAKLKWMQSRLDASGFTSFWP